ncbi:family 2 glycosyl transferase [Nostoc carneum NIES-2107]|nr:family 2 glycosyl transferase [Nostoc carneum NIES-2107]
MKNQPLISIIIPFFNNENFLEEAIESVISQTYTNWEILLVDDGSSDTSTAIAQKYAAKYVRKIFYLAHENHQNKGKSSSRNLGISHAKGEYITFLDADDIFLPLKLEKQITILQSQPDAVMVYGNTLYWYSWTGNPADKQRDYIPELGIKNNSLIQPPSLLLILLGDKGTVPCICSFLIKRKFVDNIGGFEESIQHLYEDQVFLAKVFLNAPVFVEDGCWEKYRQRDDSSWHISLYTGEDERAHLIFLNWLETYLSEQECKDAEIKRVLQKRLFAYRYPIFSKISKRFQDLVGKMKVL